VIVPEEAISDKFFFSTSVFPWQQKEYISHLMSSVTFQNHSNLSSSSLHHYHHILFQRFVRIYTHNIHPSIHLWLYNPLLDLGRFFSFLIYTQSVGLLGRGISPSQGRYLSRDFLIKHLHAFLFPSLDLRLQITVKLFPFLTNEALCHEGVWGSGCTDPHFLDTSWR
jgi:hypothetical protein